MYQESIDLLDDLDAGDVIEIEYIVSGALRYSIGMYERLEKNDDGDWCLLRIDRPDIRTIDIETIRRVKQGVA